MLPCILDRQKKGFDQFGMFDLIVGTSPFLMNCRSNNYHATLAVAVVVVVVVVFVMYVSVTSLSVFTVVTLS